MIRLSRFEHFKPRTLPEACSLLSRYKDKARAIAGGTDLLVKMKQKGVTPQYLVGLSSIPNLDYIKYDETEGLKIGALATINSVANSAIVRERFRLIADTVAKIATAQVRNIATIGGNLCNAAPSADSAPPLIALGAKVKLVSPRGERVIALGEFFTGPGETVLQTGEILVEVQVPNQPPYTGGAYLKLSRTPVDLAIVGVATLVTLEIKRGICRDVRIVLGAVAPTPMRAKRAEGLIKGKKVEEGLIEEAAQAASEEARPISDIRSSAHYRTEVVKVLTKRALKEALGQASLVTTSSA